MSTHLSCDEGVAGDNGENFLRLRRLRKCNKIIRDARRSRRARLKSAKGYCVDRMFVEKENVLENLKKAEARLSRYELNSTCGDDNNNDNIQR